MSVPINIPKLGVSMTEGTLIEWLVADGAAVSEGDPIYLIGPKVRTKSAQRPQARFASRRGRRDVSVGERSGNRDSGTASHLRTGGCLPRPGPRRDLEVQAKHAVVGS